MLLAEREAPEAHVAAVRVAIADSRRLIAEALAAMAADEPAFELVAVMSGSIDPSALAVTEPDLVLVGIGAEEAGSLRFIDALVPLVPRARIAIVADLPSPRLVRAVLEMSLGGLLLTAFPAEDLLASLRHIAHGHAVLPDGWQAVLAGGPPGPVDSLSDRQLEVLRLLAEGCSYEEIAGRLFISLNTVKFHTRSIFDRLGVRNRTAAARVLDASTRG